MTQISLHELVRRDLLNREQEGIRLYGTPRVSYNGRAAILDAYDEALNLVVFLRQVIEETQPRSELTEQIAQEFHETYERLALEFDYKTREESAKPWADVPAKNKRLMIAVVAELLRLGVIHRVPQHVAS